jgi:hypothetical protein
MSGNVGIIIEPQAYFASAESQEHYVPCPEDYPVFPPPPLKLPFKIQNSTGQKSQQGSFQLLTASSKIHHCTHFTDCMNSSSLTMFSPTTTPWKPFGESIYGPLRIFLIRMMTTQRGPPFLRVAHHILVRSFNQRIKIGLGRDMRPLITPEEVEEARNLPEHLRRYERVPSWAAKAPPVAEILVVPTNDGVFLVGKDGRRADPDFLAKNILLWTPHIYFT